MPDEVAGVRIWGQYPSQEGPVICKPELRTGKRMPFLEEPQAFDLDLARWGAYSAGGLGAPPQVW